VSRSARACLLEFPAGADRARRKAEGPVKATMWTAPGTGDMAPRVHPLSSRRMLGPCDVGWSRPAYSAQALRSVLESIQPCSSGGPLR